MSKSKKFSYRYEIILVFFNSHSIISDYIYRQLSRIVMAKKLPNKRQRNQYDGPPKKQPKVEMLNILNEDCLEHIFKKLDISDLLNVADSSIELLPAARSAFVSKYGKVRVSTKYPYSYYGPPKKSIAMVNGDIFIYDLPTFLKFMRLFGQEKVEKFATTRYFLKHLIKSNVSMTLDDLQELTISGSIDQHVIDFIGKHRSVSKLVCYNMFQMGGPKMLQLAKVLPAVTQVCLHWCVSVDEAVILVNGCKQLKKAFFNLAERADLDELQKRLDKKWGYSVPPIFST